MDTQEVVWSSDIRNLPWPKSGITYSYHDRYIHLEKLKRWLEKAFGGRDKADYCLRHGRIYIKAPRKPTLAEFRWMQDNNHRSGVQVAECGWLTL